jgi:hypothetical protein
MMTKWSRTLLMLTLCLDKHVEEDDYNSTVTIIYVVKMSIIFKKFIIYKIN